MGTNISRQKPMDARARRAVAVYHGAPNQVIEQKLQNADDVRLAAYYALDGGARWVSQGVTALGMEVDALATVTELERTIGFLDPRDGKRLPTGSNRSPGTKYFDWTHTTYKEISFIKRIAPSDLREQMEQVRFDAMARSIDRIQLSVGVVRKGAGGAQVLPAVAMLIWDTPHEVSRAVDGKPAPHTHDHVGIVNQALYVDPDRVHLIAPDVADDEAGEFVRATVVAKTEVDGEAVIRIKFATGAHYDVLHESSSAEVLAANIGDEVRMGWEAGAGTWSAIDERFMISNLKRISELYDAELREGYKRVLDCAWELDDKGVWRMAGFDESCRKRMSPRQQQIIDKIEKDGLDPSSWTDAEDARRATRVGKDKCSSDLEVTAWRVDQEAALGFTLGRVMSDVQGEATRLEQAKRDRIWIDANVKGPLVGVNRIDTIRDIARQIDQQGISGELRSVAEGLRLMDEAPTQKSMDRVFAALEADARDEATLAHETMVSFGLTNSTWSQNDLIAALGKAGVTDPAASRYVAAYLRGEQVIEASGYAMDDPENGVHVRPVDEIRYGSVELLSREQDLIHAAAEGLGQYEPLADEARAAEVYTEMARRGKELAPDSDQFLMVETLLLGTNRIVIIDGQPGSGKSAAFEGLAIQELVIAASVAAPDAPIDVDGVEYLRLVGATLTANAAENLKAESGVASFSLAMLLYRLQVGRIVLERGATVIVDEASMAGTNQLWELWNYIDAVGGRMVLAGDTRQLQAVEAGGMMRTLVEETPSATLFLDETRRQENPDERAVIATYRDCGLNGEHRRLTTGGYLRPESLAALVKAGADGALVTDLNLRGLEAVRDYYFAHDRVHVSRNHEETIAAAARMYCDLTEGNDDAPADAALLVTATNEVVRQLDSSVSEHLVETGRLSDTEQFEFARRDFRVDQRVTARKVDNWKNHAKNGEISRIIGVESMVTSWKVVLDTPQPWDFERDLLNPVKEGDSVKVKFSAGAVARERAKANRNLNKQYDLFEAARLELNEATSPDKHAELKAEVKKQKERTKKAETWLSVAKSSRASAVTTVRKREDAIRAAKRVLRGAHTEKQGEWARTAIANNEGWLVQANERLTRLSDPERFKVREEAVRRQEEREDKAKSKLRELRSQKHLDTVHANLASQRDSVTAAHGWLDWAYWLPAEGGEVDLKVKSWTAGKVEERLVSQMDNGEMRYFDQEYAHRHLDSGYAATTTRTQGATTEVGITVESFGLVDVTRARKETHSFFTVEFPVEEFIAEEAKKLEDTHAWLASTFEDEGVNGRLGGAFTELRSVTTKTDVSFVVNENLRVHAELGPAALQSDVVGRFIGLSDEGDAAVVVAATEIMAQEYSDAIVRARVAQSEGREEMTSLDGRLWCAGQRVLIEGGNVGEIMAGQIAVVEGVSSGRVALRTSEGQRAVLEDEDVREHLRSLLAVSSQRDLRDKMIEPQASRLIVDASGLTSENLDWVKREGVPVDLYLTDPTLSAEAEETRLAEEKMLSMMRTDSRARVQTISGTMRNRNQEQGLDQLQAQLIATRRNAERAQGMTPRDLAKSDLTQRLVQLNKQEKDLARRVGDRDLTDLDHADAEAGIRTIALEREIVQARYAVLTGSASDDDPEVLHELSKSRAHHVMDNARVAREEHQLKRFVQLRVEQAVTQGTASRFDPYLSVDPALSQEKAAVERLKQISALIEYRTRWAVDKKVDGFGPKPDNSAQLEDWISAKKMMHGQEHTQSLGFGQSYAA